MQLLADIITYVRRIVKSPSNTLLSDNLIIDYINRFWINDVDARIQLFDLKTNYQFQTQPGVDAYNMPLYSVQSEGGQTVGMFPVYQGFVTPAYINGIQVPLQTQKNAFYNIFPDVVQNIPVVGIGDGTAGPYTFNFGLLANNPVPLNPPLAGLLRGHVDITGIIALGTNIDPPVVSSNDAVGIPTPPGTIEKVPTTSVYSRIFISTSDASGANVIVQDSGQFLDTDVNYGLLMSPGSAPNGNKFLPGGYSTTQNTINYFSGIANVQFPVAIPAGQNISAQCFFFETGLPRSILFYNNILTLRSPPNRQYLVELEAYLSPAAFFNTEQAIPFGYMAEYIARGAARKILSDTGDVEQFMFYEPLFKEQELLVWKRSQRQWTNNRTDTIYSQGFGQGQLGFNNLGAGSI